jgi:hypothetical protein
MDFELSDAKYREDLPLLLRVQMVVMKSKSITIFPIFRANSDYLQCVFPTEKKDVLFQILCQHKEKLSNLFGRLKKQRSQLLKIIRAPKGYVDASVIGSFVGGFVGGIIKEMSRV